MADFSGNSTEMVSPKISPGGYCLTLAYILPTIGSNFSIHIAADGKRTELFFTATGRQKLWDFQRFSLTSLSSFSVSRRIYFRSVFNLKY